MCWLVSWEAGRADCVEDPLYSPRGLLPSQVSNFVKIDTVGTELFHADGQMDRHDEANSHCSQFCERA